MKVRHLQDPAVFLDAALQLLLQDEARHNLMLGIAGTLRDDPGRYPEHRLWLVEADGEVTGAALRTPPFNLVLARPRDDEALRVLAAGLDDEPPGVTGALPEAETFAGLWPTPGRVRMRQGLYALERVEPVDGVPGRIRDASLADRALLLDWFHAFAEEALPEQDFDEDQAARGIEHRLTAEGTGHVLWEDGDPVSFAGFGGQTPNGVRIGPVYTPPEYRRRGYASALTAELSARLLAGGRRFCFLYTDLANPTSNRIYERIGYERVCESAEIVFE